ncbi:unnamed protein product [Trichobilharzia regenti]|nr:unnamed protein product [Trichobilharzia regenti]
MNGKQNDIVWFTDVSLFNAAANSFIKVLLFQTVKSELGLDIYGDQLGKLYFDIITEVLLLPLLFGLVIDLHYTYKSITDHIIVLQSNKHIHLTIFGKQMDYITHISFASIKKPPNSPFHLLLQVTTSLRELSSNEAAFFRCIRIIPVQISPPRIDSSENTASPSSSSSSPEQPRPQNYSDIDGKWIYANVTKPEYRLSFRTTSALMPLWVQIILIIFSIWFIQWS